MANKYAGTQTEKNLREAFSGESQAYIRLDDPFQGGLQKKRDLSRFPPFF